MDQIFYQRLNVLFDLTTDLARSVNEKHYQSRLGRLPSNTFGSQLWCIIGARESSLEELETGVWQGFSCSVMDKHNKLQVMQALHASGQNILKYIETCQLSQSNNNALLGLLEHESQHHGQLIRYVYGNKWVFPQSWTDHYTV